MFLLLLKLIMKGISLNVHVIKLGVVSDKIEYNVIHSVYDVTFVSKCSDDCGSDIVSITL